MRHIAAGLALMLLTLASAVAGEAQQGPRTTSFAVKGILLMPGDAYVAEADAYFEIEMSFGIGAEIDAKLGEKFWGGLYADLLNVTAYDESEMMLDAGIALKAAFGGEHGRPLWRPGFGLGYGTLSGGASLDATHYLTIRAGVEAVMPTGWLVEANLYAAPTGGNDAVTVTYGPLIQFRVGHVF
jgi:hypothetical protein